MFARAIRAALLGFVLLLVSLADVSAHVTVEPTEGPTGGVMAYTFRVPTEKNVATTTLRIEFPPDLVVSRFMPKVGWEREVLRDSNQRIIGVVWSRGSLAPDEYDEFSIVARNPRQAGKIAFKAYQGYADGSVVEWVGPETAEEPAPVVNIVEATGAVADAHGQVSGSSGTAPTTGGAGGSSTTNSSGSGAGAESPTAASGGGSDLSLFLALAATIVAVIAVAVAAVALVRRPQPT